MGPASDSRLSGSPSSSPPSSTDSSAPSGTAHRPAASNRRPRTKSVACPPVVRSQNDCSIPLSRNVSRSANVMDSGLPSAVQTCCTWHVPVRAMKTHGVLLVTTP
eukprot:4424243-Prymnesium_polylepis.1